MLTLFLSVLALMPSSEAERPSPPRTGNFEFGLRYDYFTTGANYDQNGSKTGIPRGGGLSTDQGHLTGAYDWARRWRTFASVNYNRVTSTDGFFDRDNGGITDVGLGAQYFTVYDRFLLIPQLDGRITTYTVSETSDQAAIAEGVNTARLGSWIIWRLGEFQPFIYAGGEYRDASRSSLGHYVGGLHFKSDAFWAEATLRGYFSATDDADQSLAGRARRNAYLAKVNGSSLRFYSVNPGVTEVALETGFILDQFNLFAGASMTVAGQSTAEGWGAWGGVRFTLATRAGEPAALGPTTESSGFEPQQDHYDSTIFTDQPALGQKRPRALRPRPRPKRPDRRSKQQQNLNRLLDETEKGLEERRTD